MGQTTEDGVAPLPDSVAEAKELSVVVAVGVGIVVGVFPNVKPQTANSSSLMEITNTKTRQSSMSATTATSKVTSSSIGKLTPYAVPFGSKEPSYPDTVFIRSVRQV